MTMDLTNRGGHPNQVNGQHSANTNATRPRGRRMFGNNLRYGWLALFISVVILLTATVAVLGFSDTGSEAKYVNDKKYQAVFLNGGQVYFGKVGALNNKYVSMSDIYYLRVNQQVQPNQKTTSGNNNVSLVKLGCELHGPQDQMLINREQVVFWENLKDDGQVAKAIAEFKKTNPNGQNCTQQQTQTPTQTPTGTQKKP